MQNGVPKGYIIKSIHEYFSEFYKNVYIMSIYFLFYRISMLLRVLFSYIHIIYCYDK